MVGEAIACSFLAASYEVLYVPKSSREEARYLLPWYRYVATDSQRARSERLEPTVRGCGVGRPKKLRDTACVHGPTPQTRSLFRLSLPCDMLRTPLQRNLRHHATAPQELCCTACLPAQGAAWCSSSGRGLQPCQLPPGSQRRRAGCRKLAPPPGRPRTPSRKHRRSQQLPPGMWLGGAGGA